MVSKNKILASIIIRSYNQENMINECLTKVLNQKIGYPFEVIVVDSGSTDKTLEIVKKFPMKLIQIKKKKFSLIPHSSLLVCHLRQPIPSNLVLAQQDNRLS